MTTHVRPILRTAAKVVVGAAFYLLLLVVARSMPGAAGVLLTFPALNGLTLLFAGREAVALVTGTMLAVPLLNAATCFAYIMAIEEAPRIASDPAWTHASLAVLCLAWLGAARLAATVHVPPGLRNVYAVSASLLLLALVALFGSPLSEPVIPHASGTISSNMERLALFVVCLVILAVYTEERWFTPSPGILGVLGGLPLVAFIGLATAASDASRTLEQRLASLHDMHTTLWLGPIVAIWFVHLFGAYLARRSRDRETAPLVRDVLVLLGAWAIALVAVHVLHVSYLHFRPS